MPPWLDAGRARGGEWDRRGARWAHRAVLRPGVRRLFAAISRLGNTAVWLAVLVLLPLADTVRGARVAQGMLLLGSVNLLLYWALKRSTRRRRPFEQCEDIRACVHVPDAFSFPSGHTLHAVAFAALLGTAWPALALPLWALAGCIGAARVVLGVHYPSDVLVGAALGLLTGGLVAAWL